MFIEELWDKNPELVEKAVKKIYYNYGEMGNDIEFVGHTNVVYVFVKHGNTPFSIYVRDFDIHASFESKEQCVDSDMTIEWMKFMKRIFGDKYMYHYIAYRNKLLDRYAERFNRTTKGVLKDLGFDVTATKTENLKK